MICLSMTQLYVHCHARKVSVNHIYGCHFIYSCSRVGEQFVRSLDWFKGKLAGPRHISTGKPVVSSKFSCNLLVLPVENLTFPWPRWAAARGARGATARQRRSSFFKDPRYGQSVRVPEKHPTGMWYPPVN